MATYVTTVKFTAQGLTAVQDTCKRAAAFKAAAKKLKCKVISQYWTLGPFDGVLVFEAPADEAATALMLQLAARGFVQTQTARAFTAAEMEKLLGTAAE
jgi:uncharacterized protein with GYD domain